MTRMADQIAAASSVEESVSSEDVGDFNDVISADPETAAKPGSLWQRWRERSTAFLTSTLLHSIVLLVLAFWILPEMLPGDGLDLTLRFSAPVAPDSLAIDVSSLPAMPSSSAMADVAKTHQAVSELIPPSGTLPTPTRIDPLRVVEPPPVLASSLNLGSDANLSEAVRPMRPVRDPAGGGIVPTKEVGQAVTGILGHIRKELEDDSVQVIWLLDASLSLFEDRQYVAAHLLPFYKEMAARPDARDRPLRSAVVSYGIRPSIIQPPTTNFSRVVQAVSRMALDPSGLENVFTAMHFTLENYGKFKGTTIVVIWTDESGDDLLLLESVIQRCLKENVVVHVVGPQSVLGMEQGLQRYVMPETGQAFLLPVKRGPDAAFPERLRVPYWFDSTSSPWSQGGAYVANEMSITGGPLREGLLAGVGPYALTRLALATGGTFSLLQRPGDTPLMDWETMRMYLPDYREAREIMADVRRSPIRQAVVSAAAVTWQANLQPPTRVFIGQASEYYPYRVSTPYIIPDLFQARLKTLLPDIMAQTSRDLLVVETALNLMDPERVDAETFYEQEESPRWQAWYALNLGRLLAMSVRLAEYRETLRLVHNGVGVTKNTNNLTLIESPLYKVSPLSQKRALAAKQLLQRVISDHPDTPWAKMARWELQHELGFVVRPLEIPPPPPPKPGPVTPARPAPGPPRLPNL